MGSFKGGKFCHILSRISVSFGRVSVFRMGENKSKKKQRKRSEERELGEGGEGRRREEEKIISC